MEKPTQINVAILVFNGVELVDMNGPIDVFVHANRYIKSPAYNVYTVAASTKPITSENKVVTITPQYSIDNCPLADIIVIPGCIDANNNSVPADKAIIDWLKQTLTEEVRKLTILSVCVGLFTLAETGLINGKKATTHYLAIDYVHTHYPFIQLVKNVRYVEDGRVVTTAGITSGIDGVLFLVEKHFGSDIAQETADVMVYNREAPLPPYTILPPYYPAN